MLVFLGACPCADSVNCGGGGGRHISTSKHTNPQIYLQTHKSQIHPQTHMPVVRLLRDTNFKYRSHYRNPGPWGYQCHTFLQNINQHVDKSEKAKISFVVVNDIQRLWHTWHTHSYTLKCGFVHKNKWYFKKFLNSRDSQSLLHDENCVLWPKKIWQEADTNRKHCVRDWTLFVSVSDADTNTCHSPNMLQHWQGQKLKILKHKWYSSNQKDYFVIICWLTNHFLESGFPPQRLDYSNKIWMH